jgi:sec-independent protein translocase protein TatA
MIIIIVALLLFAAPKLPDMARNLGQSMRIIKSEVKEMKNDGKPEHTEATGPVEGTIVNHPKARPGEPSRNNVSPSNSA